MTITMRFDFFFVKCLKTLLRDNVIIKVERDDEFQKTKKYWKIDLILKIDEKKRKCCVSKIEKKKCRNEIKHLN